MRKIFTVAIASLLFAGLALAQPKALGIRATYGAEISYQHSNMDNFMEFDLGWHGSSGFNLAGIYDFVFASPGNFNFYAGPGADISIFKYVKDTGESKSGLALGVAGQIGMEYNFNIPLSLSLDWRPVFNFLGNFGFGWTSIALGIRYKF